MGEGERVIAVAVSVINRLQPIKQTPEKRLTKWHKGEGTVDPMFQDPVILGIQKPTKLDVRVAERKSLPLFPRPMTKNCCAWSASTGRTCQRRNRERKGEYE